MNITKPILIIAALVLGIALIFAYQQSQPSGETSAPERAVTRPSPSRYVPEPAPTPIQPVHAAPGSKEECLQAIQARVDVCVQQEDPTKSVNGGT